MAAIIVKLKAFKMATTRSPPPPGYAPSESSIQSESKCFLCRESMNFEIQECYVISTCHHIFHRICVEQALSSSAECPICKISCELVDLRKHKASAAIQNEIATQTDVKGKPKPSVRGRSRGAMSNRPQTRNFNKNQSPRAMNYSLNVSPRQTESNLIDVVDGTPPRNQQSDRGIFQNSVSDNDNHTSVGPNALYLTSGEFDYNRINQMVENSILRIFQSMNMGGSQSATQPPTSGPNEVMPQMTVEPPNFMQPQIGASSHRRDSNNMTSGITPNLNSMRPEKATSIIQNWNIKFSGSSSGLTVEEFLYRIKSLTAEHFNNNFDLICKNIPVLLSDKADKWYWRYHKQVDTIQWNDFCEALRYQYKDMRSNFDLKEDLRNRKMKPGETFESYYEAISAIVDRLDHPVPEEELVEILVRNLRLDIRHELLYVPIYSIAHLRKLVQKRESLMSEEPYRKGLPLKPNTSSQFNTRKSVAEVQFKEEGREETPPPPCIDAVNNVLKCWNCEEAGHFWDNCLKDRTIFCYGCGTKNVYKPQCPRCANRKATFNSKNYQRPEPFQNQP